MPSPLLAAIGGDLWLLCEVDIIACDLTKMLGSALALKLLFGIPLAWEAIITGLDVMFTSALQHYGMRKLEAVLVLMIAFLPGRSGGRLCSAA